MYGRLPDPVYPAILAALIGEIDSDVIAATVYKEKTRIILEYHLNHEPNESDFEDMYAVATNIDAGLPINHGYFTDLDVNCVRFSDEYYRSRLPKSVIIFKIRKN